MDVVNALQGIVLIMLAVSQVGMWLTLNRYINREDQKRGR